MGLLVFLSWTSGAVGAGTPALAAGTPALAAGTPAPTARTPADGDAAANVHVVAPPAPVSKLDSELIRQGTGRSGTTLSPSSISTPRPQGLELPRLGAALAAVIALILLLRWGGRKLFSQPGTGKSNGSIQVLSRSPLTARQSVLLIRVGKRVLVVGDSGSQMNALAEISDPDEVASIVGQVRENGRDVSAKSFGSLFSRAKRDMNAQSEAADVGDDSPLPHARDHADGEPALDPSISRTRDELSGLMEKVRQLSQNMRGSRT